MSKSITLEFTNDDARATALYLRKKYGKDNRTGLRRLCEIAVKKEVARQAEEELREAERELEEESRMAG